MVGSFLSGGLLSSFGWSTVLVLSFAPLVIALLALLGFSYRARTPHLASAALAADNVTGQTIIDDEQVEP